MLKVLITTRYFAVNPKPLDLLRAHGCELVHSDIDWTRGDGNVSEDRAIALLQDVDGAIVSSLPLTEHVLAHAGQLKVVAIRGVGYDSVDIPEATARPSQMLRLTPGGGIRCRN
jgi:D-3-phosphoglycerate dehydrogenase / 2-oxoglutarate reductase